MLEKMNGLVAYSDRGAKMTTMSEKTNYGNWVPEKALYMLFGASAILLVLAVALQLLVGNVVVIAIVGVLCAVTLVMAIYMFICHEEFAFGKGNMMAGVHEHLVEHLDWDGNGTLLDIGCGAAALTVRCAKTFPKAKITAMDYWGSARKMQKSRAFPIVSPLRRAMPQS